ncbi:MAG: PQQ-dependent sugar dehydrogenase, partial [Pseudomonadota bacterium]|nr:PQQ-dependent sugar dehydrogenase [Pseudomonadota bacterium]
FLGPDEILFTERGGGIGKVSLHSGQVSKLQAAPEVLAEGQGGLLDVAVLPGYVAGDWVYFTYVKNQDGQGVTVLARAKIVAGKLVQWRDLLVSDSASKKRIHFGSRIAFDGKGHLFFTVGDRGVRPSAQDLSNHNGSVIRLNLDGSIPEDNPFMGNLSMEKTGALPGIWSYGHRNPQGIAYDAVNKRLWVIEHGPRGGDEINLVLPGRNYGWPEISYGKEYWGPADVADDTHRDGMEQPHKVYIPSIAPSSLLLYQGCAFPGWRGDLFAGALRLTHINRVSVSATGELIGEERLLEDFGERIRDLIEGPDGLIYFSTDSGKIFRLSPAIDQN